jgi:hypothetical protein
MNEWRFARKEFQAESSIHNYCRGFAVRGNRERVFGLMDKIEMKGKTGKYITNKNQEVII